jgi:hypothetical protein
MISFVKYRVHYAVESASPLASREIFIPVAGTGWLCFGLFIKITSELLENDVHGIDSSMLSAVAKMRRPWLSIAFRWSVCRGVFGCALPERRRQLCFVRTCLGLLLAGSFSMFKRRVGTECSF